MDIETRLRKVFTEALDLGGDVDVDALTYRGIEAWDSVGHMSLVAAIEDEFDIELGTDQVIDLASFQVARTLVAELASA